MRIQTDSPVQSQSTDKWAVQFRSFVGTPGQEQELMPIVSANVFDTEDDAIEAGNRALDLLEQTGKFPDLTGKF